MANYRKIDITDAFSLEGLCKLSKGQTVTFLLDGEKTTYKIVKIDDNRVWAKIITLFKPEDIIFGEKDNEKIYGKWKNKVAE